MTQSMFNPSESRKICEAATPGPWKKVGGGTPHYMAIHSSYGYIIFQFADPCEDTEGSGEAIEAPGMNCQAANARFIAHAREALPAACEEVEKLRQRISDLENFLYGMRDELIAVDEHSLKVCCGWCDGVQKCGRAELYEHKADCPFVKH